jgi:hypothetical protein
MKSEDRGTSSEHVPVSREELAADLERHVPFSLAPQEGEELPLQVGWRHHERPWSDHGLPVDIVDDDFAPDPETIIS